MADSVEFSTFETSDGTIGIVRDNAARQSIANIREGKEAVGAVAWENVKDRPTNVSSFQNDKNYQTEEDVANTLNGTLYAGSSTHGGAATSADKLTTARTISLTGAASGSGSFDGSANSSINVSGLDATKLTGMVPITNLPPSVIERMSVVKDDTERFALTTDSVQDGDVVKVQSTNLMYYVVDDTKLSTEAGYEVFKAGSAASVPWGGVTDKPSTFPPSSHTHTKSQITDFPSSMPNPKNLTMQIEGNDAAVYNGGTAQTFNVTKSSLGLDKVNNTADADKSVKYASSAPWIGVTGKPSTFPPSSHTHSMSQITDLGVFGGASATAAGSAGLVPQPAAGDQDKYLSAKGTWESITGKISGTKVTAADTADSIKAYTTRPASANKLFGDGKLRYFLATSSMTEGKPTLGDSAVLDLAWDNDGGWDAQIAIPMPNGPLQIRAMEKGTWRPWKSIAYKSDIPTSLPASDVYSWAKASSKPTYTASEVGAQPVGYYLTAAECSGTVDDLIKQRSGTSGGMGSVEIKQKSSGVGSEIPGGWYNYFYSPHRTGIGDDNYLWATVILTPMTFSGDSYILRIGAIDDTNKPELVEVRNINSPEFLSATDKSVNVATVPYYSYYQLNQEFGTGDATDTETYLKNWVKKIVKSHSNLSAINIIATANPNSAGTIIFRAYSCTDYNGTGMPEFCKGILFNLGDRNTVEFGTFYGVWYFDRPIMANEVSVGRTDNSVVRRSQDGYIFATYFNQGSGEEVPNSSSYVVYCNSDGYFRKSSFANIKKFVGGSQSVASTLLASGWSGSAAPYTYDLGSTYANKSVMIGYDGTKYSEDSMTAASDADIVGGEGTVIYAYGEKPTVDIPIIIQYS